MIEPRPLSSVALEVIEKYGLCADEFRRHYDAESKDFIVCKHCGCLVSPNWLGKHDNVCPAAVVRKILDAIKAVFL